MFGFQVSDFPETNEYDWVTHNLYPSLSLNFSFRRNIMEVAVRLKLSPSHGCKKIQIRIICNCSTRPTIQLSVPQAQVMCVLVLVDHKVSRDKHWTCFTNKGNETLQKLCTQWSAQVSFLIETINDLKIATHAQQRGIHRFLIEVSKESLRSHKNHRGFNSLQIASAWK